MAYGKSPKQAPSQAVLWAEAREALDRDLKKNLKQPDKRSPYRYTRPAPKFDAIYLWDSAFISQIWRHKDPEVAKDSLRSVLHYQQKNGRLPLSVDILGVNKATQPPLIAWAASRILEVDPDASYAREIAPKLKRYHDWINKERRTKSGLYFWIDTFESGMDNSPRVSNRDNSRNKDVENLEAIDFSSYMVMDAEALIKIYQLILDTNPGAEEVKLFTSEIESLKQEIKITGELIRTRLWDEEKGAFFDRDLHTDKLTSSFSIASFLPLTAGVATPDQARRLMTHILDPEKFNTPVPFPSLSASDKDFELDMWRGPVWVNSAYLVILGMKRYGENEAAREMSYRLVDGVYKTWFHSKKKFYEYYDPFRFDIKKLTRKKGEGWFGYFSGSNNVGEIFEHLITKRIFLGNKPVKDFVGWTGLVQTLELEEDLYPGLYDPAQNVSP